MENLQIAVSALQTAVSALQVRLAAYPGGTYDAEIAILTEQVNLITVEVDALAPTPQGRALELTAIG